MAFSDFGKHAAETADQWSAILELAAKWHFLSIRNLAIRTLTSLASPIDKIVLGRKHGIIEWLNDAYEAVCLRSDSLSLEEGWKLQMEDIIKISSLRYQIAKERFKRCPELSNLITITFGLAPPRSEAAHGGSESVTVVNSTAEMSVDKSVDAADTAVPQDLNTTLSVGQHQSSKKRQKLERKLKRAVEMEKLEAEQANKSASVETRDDVDERTLMKDPEAASAVMGPVTEESRNNDENIRRPDLVYKFKPLEPL